MAETKETAKGETASPITLGDKILWALPEGVQTFVTANSYSLGIAWSCFGIIGFLVVYGLLQERVMKSPYQTPDGEEEMFTWSLFLVLMNRLVTCSAAIIALYRTAPQEMYPVAPIYKYAAVSISNVVATFCQYEALRYVSFPLQTLGKTAKMVPVMIWGSLISKKKYGLKDYLIAVGVTAGCAVFVLYGDEFENKRKNSQDSSMYGVALMGGYLLFDGFTSTFQDKLFSGYKMTTYNQIFYVQGCSAFFSAFSLLSSGQLVPAYSFLSTHPDALFHTFLLSMSSTSANFFISWTIKSFGALIFATIMTTRQFISILMSCVIFLHPLSWPGQYVGIALVFSALYYKSLTSKGHGHGSKPAAPAADEEAGKPLVEQAPPAPATAK